VVATLVAEPIYQSELQLLVEPNYIEKNSQDTKSEYADPNIQIDYATQLLLLQSTQLVQRAVDRLLPKYPDLTVWEVRQGLLLSQLTTEEGVTSKIFLVTYQDSDPVKTFDVLRALQKVYQDYNLEQQRVRLQRGLSFINEQLPEVQEQLLQAESHLEQFRGEHDVVDPGEESSSVASTLNTVKQQQLNIQADLQSAQARFNSLQQQLGHSPKNALTLARMNESSRYQALLDEIQKTELALTNERLRFTESAPAVKELEAQLQSQLSLLETERQALGAPSTQLEASVEREVNEGQLSKTDTALSYQLANAQNELTALEARDRQFSQFDHMLSGELEKFPQLLSQYGRLQLNVQTQQGTLAKLLEARQELALEIARGGFNWQLVEDPLEGKFMGPKMLQRVLLGLVAGLFLGGVAAFTREAIDDVLRTSEDLKKRSSLPLLGILPELTSDLQNEAATSFPFFRGLLKANYSPDSYSYGPDYYFPQFREALDLIYKNVQFQVGNKNPLSLTITSALPGEGKSTLALGLALSAARLSQRVLLVDADMRRPSIHKQLNLPNDLGLSTLLAGQANAVSLARASLHGSSIDILTAGPLAEDPIKLLSSAQMKQLMRVSQQQYDLVLIDVPPVMGMADTVEVASLCDAVIVAARVDRITQSDLEEATSMLQKFNPIGIVANGAKEAAKGYSAWFLNQGYDSLHAKHSTNAKKYLSLR
jgi:capsular exopolysaccharide synthesis family protein